MKKRHIKFILFWSPIVSLFLYINYTGYNAIGISATKLSTFSKFSFLFFTGTCFIMASFTIMYVIYNIFDSDSSFRKWYTKHIHLW